jgi:hypothetical protein
VLRLGATRALAKHHGHLVPLSVIGSPLHPDMGVFMVWKWPICGPPMCAFFGVCFDSVYCMLPFFSIPKKNTKYATKFSTRTAVAGERMTRRVISILATKFISMHTI